MAPTIINLQSVHGKLESDVPIVLRVFYYIYSCIEKKKHYSLKKQMNAFFV